MSTSVPAVGFSCGTRSPESHRELVRGYVIAFLPSYKRLRGLQGSPRGEAEAAVRIALKRRQVVEERRALGLLLALDVLDGPRLAGNLLDDLRRRARPP